MTNQKYLKNVIPFFLVLLVGSSIAKEINKQLPPELKINSNKIFLEAIYFTLIIGGLIYIILKLEGIC